MFSLKEKKQLKELFEKIENPVQILYFFKEVECDTCIKNNEFVEEISKLSKKIFLKKIECTTKNKISNHFKIEMVPAIILTNKQKIDFGIRYYGLPGGYEINSFVNSILEVAGIKDSLPKNILERIAKVDQKIKIKIFVNLTCPYSPGAVTTAHRLALENNNIYAEMIDITTFPQLIKDFEITTTPKILINNKEFKESYSISKFLDFIEAL